MKRFIAYNLWFIALFVAISGISPNAWAHSEEAVVCVKTYSPIKVDGKLDDWARKIDKDNWNGMLEIKRGDAKKWMRAVPGYLNTLTSNVEAGNIKEPSDFGMVFFTMYDERNFYFAAIVTDDNVVTQQADKDIWQDDCVELWFDTRHDAITPTMFQDDEYQIGISPKSKSRDTTLAWVWRNPMAEPVIGAIDAASTVTSNGYIIEASIPISVLKGLKPEIGGLTGFNVSCVDKDEDELWTHIVWSGALHSDPTQFGHLYFVDAPINLLAQDLKDVK